MNDANTDAQDDAVAESPFTAPPRRDEKMLDVAARVPASVSPWLKIHVSPEADSARRYWCYQRDSAGRSQLIRAWLITPLVTRSPRQAAIGFRPGRHWRIARWPAVVLGWHHRRSDGAMEGTTNAAGGRYQEPAPDLRGFIRDPRWPWRWLRPSAPHRAATPGFCAGVKGGSVRPYRPVAPVMIRT